MNVARSASQVAVAADSADLVVGDYTTVLRHNCCASEPECTVKYRHQLHFLAYSLHTAANRNGGIMEACEALLYSATHTLRVQ